MTIIRIAKNGPMNDFNMNWSSFFIYAVARSMRVSSAARRFESMRFG